MWIAVLSSSEVRVGRPLGVRRLNMNLVFWRDKSERVNVLLDDCSHRHARLSLGRIIGNNIMPVPWL